MQRLARWCFRHGWWVIGTWLALVVGTTVAAQVVGPRYYADFRLPGADSQVANQLLRTYFPGQRGDPDLVVAHVTAGSVFGAEVRGPFTTTLQTLRRLPHVRSVSDPYTGQAGTAVAQDRRTMFATIRFDSTSANVPPAAVKAVIAAARRIAGPGLQVELTGQAVENVQQTPPRLGEALGLLAAVLVLLFTFGSGAAAGMALVTALVALVTGAAAITLATHLIAMPNFTPELALMVGLGVGIDYALFIVTRFRTVHDAGRSVQEATVTSLVTSGQAVVFAGITVVVAMLGMYLVHLPLVHGMAVGASIVVAFTMLSSVTVLPALFGLAGQHIDRLRLPLRRRRLAARSPVWLQWSRTVQRRPVLALVGSLALLVVLALPAFSLRLGSADASTDDTSTTTHRAYVLLARAFGAGFNGPLTLVTRMPSAHGAAALRGLEQAVRSDPDVAAVTTPRLDPAGTVAVLDVIPRTGPASARTAALLHRLRGSLLPRIRRANGLRVHVGGTTAIVADLADRLGGGIPLFFGGVIGASLLLLLVLFRSVLVPLKAGLMNLLSIGAAFGIVVAVFQWGWGAAVIGVDRTGPVESFLPLMLFAIVFGLSMDYEVFLLSRIREEWLRNGDNSAAVADGLATTGRVITAAAAIMIVVFASFVLGGERTIKLFGLGLAAAIFLDAVLVRTVLVPATMELLGRRNWWLPGWLARVLPHIAVERPQIGPEPLPD